MTYTTQTHPYVTVGLIASHYRAGEEIKVRLELSGSHFIDLDLQQREELAAYLLKENN